MPLEERESTSVSDHLSDLTGEPAETFEYSGEIPEPEDLTEADASDVYSEKN